MNRRGRASRDLDGRWGNVRALCSAPGGRRKARVWLLCIVCRTGSYGRGCIDKVVPHRQASAACLEILSELRPVSSTAPAPPALERSPNSLYIHSSTQCLDVPVAAAGVKVRTCLHTAFAPSRHTNAVQCSFPRSTSSSSCCRRAPSCQYGCTRTWGCGSRASSGCVRHQPDVKQREERLLTMAGLRRVHEPGH
ncbi:hypothetical protein P280DRAFT_141157 [Massarina eburnea CBS 473.64]|uniref:Uncharacterized protein n=1 Tax=Massarina eburnea CBS 473.64 TaxID=1395130 RepID=A0A6A6RMA0_9PLEO|nr:hypothetical protein P280DRAFT_141157 [Massarina eburnea CBS 473.64]